MHETTQPDLTGQRLSSSCPPQDQTLCYVRLSAAAGANPASSSCVMLRTVYRRFDGVHRVVAPKGVDFALNPLDRTADESEKPSAARVLRLLPCVTS